jgi:phytanoyl-CoA hydroxylase
MTQRSDYISKGYCIYRKLVPENLIDAFLAEYESKIAPSPDLFYRQSTQYERNILLRTGYVRNSFMNLHSYDYPAQEAHPHHRFSYLARQIFCFEPVHEALAEVTESKSHRIVQSMLFDMNMETEPHQDTFYLDSFPAGHLLGAWFALQDIHEDAGRFFVVSGSHQTRFQLTEDEIAVNKIYLKKICRYLEDNRDKLHAPALEKGDVLFWNSMTVHGSLKTVDTKRSRKSLTAHYLPAAYEFRGMNAKVPSKLLYLSHNGVDYRAFEARQTVLPESLWDRTVGELRKRVVSFDAEPALYYTAKPLRRLLRTLRLVGSRDSI